MFKEMIVSNNQSVSQKCKVDHITEIIYIRLLVQNYSKKIQRKLLSMIFMSGMSVVF